MYKRFPKGDDIKSNLFSNDRRCLPAAARWMVSRKRGRCGESKIRIIRNFKAVLNVRTAFFVVRIRGMSKSGFKFMRKSIFRRTMSS